jgi:deoxyxylulose-5-phosphate synthase
MHNTNHVDESPKAFAITTVNKYAAEDKSVIAMSADSLSGTGLINLASRFGSFSEQNLTGRLFRLPIAENMLFRMSEGLIAGGHFPVIGIYESLLSIVMLELQSLVVAASQYNGGALILSTKPGRISHDGRSMRSTSIVQMLSAIPSLVTVDPRDLNELGSTVKIALSDKMGVTVIRVPDKLPFECRFCDKTRTIWTSSSVVRSRSSRKCILASGWLFHRAMDLAKKQSIESSVDVLGISRQSDLFCMASKYLSHYFHDVIVGTVSDTHPAWLQSILASKLSDIGVQCRSIRPIGILDEARLNSVFDESAFDTECLRYYWRRRCKKAVKKRN